MFVAAGGTTFQAVHQRFSATHYQSQLWRHWYICFFAKTLTIIIFYCEFVYNLLSCLDSCVAFRNSRGLQIAIKLLHNVALKIPTPWYESIFCWWGAYDGSTVFLKYWIDRWDTALIESTWDCAMTLNLPCRFLSQSVFFFFKWLCVFGERQRYVAAFLLQYLDHKHQSWNLQLKFSSLFYCHIVSFESCSLFAIALLTTFAIAFHCVRESWNA